LSDPLHIAVVLHLNLSAGTSPADAEALWKSAFQPLIGAVHHIPEARVGLVLAGELVEEFQQRHPEAIVWIRGLIDREQVELVGTALHEPVMSAVPERDAIGQLQAHATLLKKVFGVRPIGAWLPHGVWDPCLPRIYSRAEMSYSFIEDRLVREVVDTNADGVFRTEREGHVLALLPIDAKISEVSPGTPVKQVLAHLERRRQRGHHTVTIAFDANQFLDRREQSWLATFLAQVAKSPTMRLLRPAEALVHAPARGRVYMPSGGPKDTPVPWERCLLRYQEGNRLHKRMIRTSRLIERLERAARPDGPEPSRADPNDVLQAHRYLFRAQAATIYNHGVHPGIYDARRRALAWRDVLRAERVAMTGLGLDDRVLVETPDVDLDGTDDVVLRTAGGAMVIDRCHSAGAIEWSLASKCRNVVGTLTRQSEPYHEQMLGAERTEEAPRAPVEDDEPTLGGIEIPLEGSERQDLANAIAYDSEPRVAFVEHLIGPEVTVIDLQRGEFAELAEGLRRKPWTLVSAERHGEVAARASFAADATVSRSPDGTPIRLFKRYTLHGDGRLDVKVEVANRGREVLRCRLALELDFALSAGAAPPVLAVAGGRYATTQLGDAGEISEAKLEAEDLSLTITVQRPARMWIYPIETVNRHGSKVVLSHQGTCVVLVWPVELFTQEKARFDLQLTPT
jgi:hypothetical protein